MVYLRVEGQFQHFLELRVHDFEVVWDIEDVDARELEMGKTLVDEDFVLAFNDEDDVGPQEVGFTEAARGIWPHPGAADLQAGIVAIKALGSDAALFVHGADEEDFQGWGQKVDGD